MGDTIAAIATPLVPSAIGILRLSGPDCSAIAEKVFRGRSALRPGTAVFGELYMEDGALLDHCLALYRRAPHSYTGEDTLEFQCHGSPAVLTAGLRLLFRAGARQALAGELTKRAFLNGRLDLVQAEAVVDLIDAETEQMAKNAAAQLGGAVSGLLGGIYDSLSDLPAHFCAVLDYPDEELERFELDEVRTTLHDAAARLERLRAGFARGRVVKNGARTALIGRPNAGKSSLLNALLGYERAIVTDQAGTTRDTIEEKLLLGGVLLRVADTAGLREAEGEAERQGVRRSLEAAEGAELVLAVFDGSVPLGEDDRRVIEAAGRARRALALVNKSDLPQKLDPAPLREAFGTVLSVSAATGDGLDALAEAVAARFAEAQPLPTGELITNERQAEAIERALAAIYEALSGAEAGVTPDALLSDVELAMSALGELTGRDVPSDVTARIFSRFCVGK